MRCRLLLLRFLFSVLATPAFAVSPSDLRPPMTSQESAYYDTIKADSSAAQSFLITRAYVRMAQAVADGSLSPLSFPSQKPAGFTVKYLLPDEPSVINKALGMYLEATLKADPKLVQP
jgi:hypothetical protein